MKCGKARPLFASVLLVAVTAMLLAGSINTRTVAGAATAQASTLRIALSGEPSTLDLSSTALYESVTVGMNLYETLFTTGAHFNTMPWLVDTYEFTSDGKTLTLK